LHHLDYNNFSILMIAKRRLGLYMAEVSSAKINVQHVQEVEDGVSLAELQAELKAGSGSGDKATVNGRLAADTAPVTGLNGTVFDDFWCLLSPTATAVHHSWRATHGTCYIYTDRLVLWCKFVFGSSDARSTALYSVEEQHDHKIIRKITSVKTVLCTSYWLLWNVKFSSKFIKNAFEIFCFCCTYQVLPLR